MPTVQVKFGGRNGQVYQFETNEDLVAIRTRDDGAVMDAKLSGDSRRLLDELEPVTRFRDSGVEVFHVRSGSASVRDDVRAALKREPAIRFAGRVLADPIFKPQRAVTADKRAAASLKEPVLYSENLFVQFERGVRGGDVSATLQAAGLSIKRAIDYLHNAYFVGAPEGTGLAVFEIAMTLLSSQQSVTLCHPELLRPRQFRGAFPQQWHLQPSTVNGIPIDAHASVVDSWRISKGDRTTIAIIDTGIDVDHEEFASPGKIVAPRDANASSRDPHDPRPRAANENHGTACAGVACGDGRRGASGVAPAAKLMPIRLMAALGSQSEADAFAWAADHGADVISCSWGPVDGRWWDPTDAAHRANVPLPDNTRLAIEYALSHGRGGKGTVICWAAGNGNESADADGYASHPGVMAIAACNDTGVRSVYSDTGKALSCAFPSDDADLDRVPAKGTPPPLGGVWAKHSAPKTTGIWTTDRSGAPGYNGGTAAAGDAAGSYTNSFGGTSSAAPGVAGVAALVIAANSALTGKEVREIIEGTCDQIDRAGGRYDARGHSPLYGRGRVNAARAVAEALERGARAASPAPSRRVRASRSQPASVAAALTLPAGQQTIGVLTKNTAGESVLDSGTVLIDRSEADPMRGGSRFLDARGLATGDRIVVTGTPDAVGTRAAINMIDAGRAGDDRALARPRQAMRRPARRSTKTR